MINECWLINTLEVWKVHLDYCINSRKKPKGESRMDNPETLATLCTQDTGQRKTKQINVRENRRGNQEWTIQRHLQHFAHKKQDVDKQNTKTQKTNKTCNTNPPKNRCHMVFWPPWYIDPGVNFQNTIWHRGWTYWVLENYIHF